MGGDPRSPEKDEAKNPNSRLTSEGSWHQSVWDRVFATFGITVAPDVVVHRRGLERPNILVLEVKKSRIPSREPVARVVSGSSESEWEMDRDITPLFV